MLRKLNDPDLNALLQYVQRENIAGRLSPEQTTRYQKRLDDADQRLAGTAPLVAVDQVAALQARVTEAEERVEAFKQTLAGFDEVSELVRQLYVDFGIAPGQLDALYVAISAARTAVGKEPPHGPENEGNSAGPADRGSAQPGDADAPAGVADRRSRAAAPGRKAGN